MAVKFAPANPNALPIWAVYDGAELPPEANAGIWPDACGFTGQTGQICLIPNEKGGISGALFGLGKPERAGRERFAFARATKLPKGDWRLASFPDGWNLEQAALGWLLGQYSFTRYKGSPKAGPRLVCPDGVDGPKLEAIAAGEFLTRDLVNTPTNDMGPQQLEDAARKLANEIGADIEVISGDSLLKSNFPMIHAVGRAAEQEPRLIDIRLGDSGPLVTLVGKGVCFDTGGLDIKPPASMGLMKKDMGGAATVLGLLKMLAGTGAAKVLRLRVLIPAVENSIAGNAFRPGDVLTSRKGLTVEINNTDAEGRLVLADALTLAAEEKPDLLISMATLTGAARAATGPDIPPFYCDDDRVAQAIHDAAMKSADPLWRLPFWEPYESKIEPAIADLDNAPAGGMAGSITAALFLRRFTEGAAKYAHFDIYCWQPVSEPGRPKGGIGQGARAILAALPAVLA